MTRRSFVSTALAAALALLFHVSAYATDWYVDSGVTGADDGGITGVDTSNGTAGNDTTGSGTAAAPYLTLAKLAAVIQTGDRAYLAGRFYTAAGTTLAFTVNNLNTLSFNQWEGRSPCVIRGDIKITSAWTDNGDGTFSATIPTGLTTLADVTYAWDTSSALVDPVTSETGVRRFAHLTLAASNAAVTAAAGTADYSYFYTTGTGELRVHLSTFNTEPDDAANLVTYVPRGRGGFAITQTSVNNTIAPSISFSGMRFANFSDTAGATPAGTSIYIVDGSGCSVSSCYFEDSGLHAVSFGGYCVNNVLSGNTYVGMANGAVTVVFNATGTYSAIANAASGCRVIGDVFYANGLQNPTGVRALVAGTGSGAALVYVHGDHSDVECVNVRMIGMVPSSGTPDTFTAFLDDDGGELVGTGKASFDALDAETYPFRVRQTDPTILTVENGTFNASQGVTSGLAFIGTRLHYPQFGDNSNGACWDYAGNDGYIGFFGSENIADATRLDGTRQSMFRMGAAGTLTVVSTSVLDSSLTNSGGSNNTHHMFDFPSDSATKGTIHAYKSIFSFRATAAAGHNERRFISGDDDSDGAGAADIAVPISHLVFRDCMIWNVTAAKYSAQTAYDTAAEWYSVADPNGIELAIQPFADVTGETDLALRTTGLAWESIKSTSVYARMGSNGRANDDGYGCFMYGFKANEFDRTRARSRVSVGR